MRRCFSPPWRPFWGRPGRRTTPRPTAGWMRGRPAPAGRGAPPPVCSGAPGRGPAWPPRTRRRRPGCSGRGCGCFRRSRASRLWERWWAPPARRLRRPWWRLWPWTGLGSGACCPRSRPCAESLCQLPRRRRSRPRRGARHRGPLRWRPRRSASSRCSNSCRVWCRSCLAAMWTPRSR